MIALSEELSRRLPKARLSVSIPAELAQWTREIAARNGVPISAVVELALRKARERYVSVTDAARLQASAALEEAIG